MNNLYTNYFKTLDNQQIFFQTNFDPFEHESNEGILIFNYGLVCSNHHWVHQLDYFDEKGYRILVHDYRGHYQSSGIEDLDSITFENMTNDLYGLINHLKIKNPILIGHSMGVNISLEFNKRFPDVASKQILISGTTIPVYDIMFDSNVVDQVQPYIKKLLKAYPAAFKTFWKFGGWNPIIKKLIHAGGFNIKTVPSEFIEVYLNKLGQLGPELFFQLLDQMQIHQILGEVEIIKTKTLVIGGDKDKVIPNYLQRLLADSLPNAELYLVKNGSHVPQVDFPKFVNERMIEFIES